MDLWSPLFNNVALQANGEWNQEYIPYVILTVLIMIAFFASVGYLTYKDAKKRGMIGLAYFLVILFTGPVGLVIYFYRRGDKPIITVAPTYQMAYYKPFKAPPIKPGSKAVTRFCVRCGGLVTIEMPACPKCGNTNLLRR